MAKAKGFLTLEEAAQQLGMDVDELNQLASKREVRAFADRGTWRFKQKDIDEMLSQREAIQDEDAPIPLVGDDAGDPFDQPSDFSDPPSMGGQATSLSPGGKRRTTDKHEEDQFEFELSMDSSSFELDAGEDLGLPPAPPAPTTGGSEMHMVFDDDDFGTGAPKTNLSTSGSMEVKTGLAGSATGESESVFLDEGTGVKTSIAGGPSPYDRKTQQSFEEDDLSGSEVGLGEDVLNIDSELDLPPAESDSLDVQDQLLPTTEEVPLDDLDVQLREEEAGLEPEFGSSSSPFELSEDDLDEPPAPPTSSFESSSFDDDEVELGDLTPGSDFSSGASGINLHSPADTGVGLEKSGPISSAGGDEIEFELSLDADATPAPSHGDSDSSEFELTLDDEDMASEFGGSTTSDMTGEEKDIFETDDNIPALDDEDSGSEAVALEEVDTDLESSDFDFTGEEGSQSEVVALDEEEPVSSASSSSDDDMSMEVGIEEEEDEEEPAAATAGAAAGVGAPALPPASWGAVPVIFLTPCVVVLFLLGLMTFEMLHGMWGYRQSFKPTSLVVKPISELFGAEFKE